MPPHTAWTRHNTQTLMQRRFFTLVSDEVTHPGGGQLTYDWINMPEMVLVCAKAVSERAVSSATAH